MSTTVKTTIGVLSPETNVKTFYHLSAIVTFVVGLATTNVKIADKCLKVLTFVGVLTFVVSTTTLHIISFFYCKKTNLRIGRSTKYIVSA